MEKSITFGIIIFILVIQSVPSIHAGSCIEHLSIHVKSYETYENNEGYLSYKESRYQMTSEDHFVREGDHLFIEKINANIEFGCKKDSEIIYLKFKRPNNEEFGEQIGIELKYENASNYELRLSEKNKPGNYVDSFGNRFGFTGLKTLDEAGKWEFELFYSNHSKIPFEKSSFINKVLEKNNIWVQFARDQIIVVDRVAVTELETLRQIQNEGNVNFWRNLIVSTITILIMIWIGYATIHFMKKHHKEQIKKEEKREEERQISLLESLYNELNAISSKESEIKLIKKRISTKGNLQWIKGLLEDNKSPAHGIWNLNTQIYVAGLNVIIKGKNTKELKEALIHLTQKIKLIENYLSLHRLAKERELEKHGQIIGKTMIPLINEVMTLVDAIKKFLESEFGISKK